MSLISDYNAALEDPKFEQMVAIAIARTCMTVLGQASPDPAQLAVAKRFLLSPDSEVARHLLAVAARVTINGGSFSSDPNVLTAVNDVLLANVKAGIT